MQTSYAIPHTHNRRVSMRRILLSSLGTRRDFYFIRAVTWRLHYLVLLNQHHLALQHARRYARLRAYSARLGMPVAASTFSSESRECYRRAKRYQRKAAELYTTMAAWSLGLVEDLPPNRSDF